MSSPCVLNIRDTKGRVPPGAVYIGRANPRYRLRSSNWRNPFVIGKDGTREEVIAKYERYLIESGLINQIGELRGKDLVCWCAPEPCHGDVLLRLANDDEGAA